MKRNFTNYKKLTKQNKNDLISIIFFQQISSQIKKENGRSIHCLKYKYLSSSKIQEYQSQKKNFYQRSIEEYQGQETLNLDQREIIKLWKENKIQLYIEGLIYLNRIFCGIYLQVKSSMRNQSLYLFEEILPNMGLLLKELESPLLRNVFYINKNEVQLTLTDNHIVLSESINYRQSTHFCKLNFDTKFEVTYTNPTEESIGTPSSIKLEREGCPQQLTFTAKSSVLQSWAYELEKRINQRGFHKLFKAKKKIGKGAFATVYLAERLRDKKMVAVKAFSKEKQYSGDKGRESLENEVKLMRRLNHSNIMHLEGVYQTQNSIYVILQYLEGTQLNQFLKSGVKIQHQDAKQIIQNILRGIAHLAKNRIIHRDLKPENIMFKKDKSWETAICDFGLATYADEEKYLFVRCGTPGFVAPEIINIRDMSTKSQPISDVFSAGIIFHYLLFGHSVFEGKKYNEILTQNRACDFTFNKDIYSKLPAKTFDLLVRMLEKDPLKRISADGALNHAFFQSEMDIELPQKKIMKSNVLREVYSPLSSVGKENMTPTSVGNKMMFEMGRREVKPYYYS